MSALKKKATLIFLNSALFSVLIPKSIHGISAILPKPAEEPQAYLSESKIIDLTESKRFKYCNEFMDFTIIEIFPKDNIKDFFDLDDGLLNKNSFYNGKDICIIQHPEGKEISFSQGEILDIDWFQNQTFSFNKRGFFRFSYYFN